MANVRKNRFTPEQVLDPKRVIHPALDWVENQLIVGVQLNIGTQVVLSSSEGLIEPRELGSICEKGKISSSLVTQQTAKDFVSWLEGDKTKSVDGAELVKRIAEYLRRFIVFTDANCAEIIALWVLGSYLYPVFQTYPYIWITSKEPGSGKTVLGQIVANLAFNGEFMVSPNETHLFRLAESTRGVQVWDETEAAEEMERRRFNAMKAVLLSGYRNGGAVPRQVGRNYERSEKFHVFCPRVFIGLSKLPDTVVQRTITVQMTKRSADQEIELYSEMKQVNEEEQIRSAAIQWPLQNASGVYHRYEDPELRKTVEGKLGVTGREADDIWLPISCIASVAFGMERPTQLNDLYRVAADLGKARGKLSGWKGLDLSSSPRSSHIELLKDVRHKDVCRAALELLEFKSPIEPSDLAKRVSESLDQQVSPQGLSKALKRLGIFSQKVRGKRVFGPSAEALRKAMGKLNGGLEEKVSRGQDGQKTDDSKQLAI